MKEIVNRPFRWVAVTTFSGSGFRIDRPTALFDLRNMRRWMVVLRFPILPNGLFLIRSPLKIIFMLFFCRADEESMEDSWLLGIGSLFNHSE